jgi:hypothetical protein
VGVIEQDLHLDRERADPFFHRELAGKIRSVDGVGVQIGRHSRQRCEGCQPENGDPLPHGALLCRCRGLQATRN